MSTPILLTKLFVPDTRPELVSRSNLVDQLNNGLDRKLTLISAPAGFGKTTVVTNWLHTQEGDDASPFLIGWLSLDEDDNDPVRFLTYMITALNRIPGLETEIGAGALQMAQASQLPPPQTILTAVINEIAMITNKIVLVIDDYHLIDSQLVHNALIFLLENLPPQLHVVITTREDPPIQISRLRTRGQLNEFRAVDLRFSTAEIDEFLNQIMGLGLSTQDITALEKRTEGWVAGLQLAAISMQGRTDKSNFIQSFTGSHHFVIDYLVDEVLKHQPDHIREFLLQTSILDRLTGPLCDAITSRENGQATLEMLEHSNLFIIRLDSERQWYRYHHLFADLLRQRLYQMQPQKKRTLHALASEWYEQQGLNDEAIEHVLQSENYEQATQMINEHIEEMWRQGKLGRLLRWLEKLPDEYINNSPNICIFLAWNLFTKGDQEKAESVLQFIEKNLDLQSDLSSDNPIEKGETSARLFVKKIRGRVAAIRAVMASYRSDAIESKKFASLAQALLPVDDLNWRSAAAMALADAYVFMGDYDSAHQARFESINICKAAGNTYIYLIDRTKFILVLKARGELLQAKAHCQQLIEYAIDNGFTGPGTIGWIQAILGDILAETNDLDGAFEIVREGVNLNKLGRDVTLLGWSNMCLTRILLSIGDFNGAENIIKKTEVMSQKATIPPLVNYQMMNYRVRVWLSQGRLDEAIKWMREQMEDSESKSTYVGRRINIPIARIRIAQQLPEKANELLLPLLDAAEAGGHISRAIELLILQALSLQAGDEIERALVPLDKALSLAQPRGFFRIFVDEGPPMARLLYEALSREISPEYVQKLLAAFPDVEPEKELMSKLIVSDSEWIEPLSERELEVLQLIAEGLSRPEIASQLVLSLNTVKTHARNIYSKLGVNNQMQAVGKARGLGLLDKD